VNGSIDFIHRIHSQMRFERNHTGANGYLLKHAGGIPSGDGVDDGDYDVQNIKAELARFKQSRISDIQLLESTIQGMCVFRQVCVSSLIVDSHIIIIIHAHVDMKKEDARKNKELHTLSTSLRTSDDNSAQLQAAYEKLKADNFGLRRDFERLREDNRDTDRKNFALNADLRTIRNTHDECQNWIKMNQRLLKKVSTISDALDIANAKVVTVEEAHSLIERDHMVSTGLIKQLETDIRTQRSNAESALEKLSALNIDYTKVTGALSERTSEYENILDALSQEQNLHLSAKTSFDKTRTQLNELRAEEKARTKTTEYAEQVHKKTLVFLGLRVEEGPPEGLSVIEVLANQAADEAGIEVGDIVVEMDGEQLTDAKSFKQLTQQFKIGQRVAMLTLRDGIYTTCMVHCGNPRYDSLTIDACARIGSVTSEDFAVVNVLIANAGRSQPPTPVSKNKRLSGQRLSAKHFSLKKEGFQGLAKTVEDAHGEERSSRRGSKSSRRGSRTKSGSQPTSSRSPRSSVEGNEGPVSAPAADAQASQAE
jgi:hypothetical protein